jgi:energy-coupling factor transporter transmembrane protein EcfT
VFVWQIIKGFQRSRPEWFLTIFMIPFVLIGILFVGMVIHQFLALFNPRVTLTVHNAAVRLGDILQLDWETSGRVTALALFAIKLEGREEATFQQGTSTRTDKHIFTSIVVHETDQPVDIMTGHAQVMIPSHLVASFNAPCNKIIWTLNVTGQIRFWPDLKEEYEIVVLPSRTRS